VDYTLLNIPGEFIMKRAYFKSDTGSTNTSTHTGHITSVFHNIKTLCHKLFLNSDFHNIAKGVISIQVPNYSQQVCSRKQAICQ